MRKRPLFELGKWAVALLGLVSLTLAGQVQAGGQGLGAQASGQQSPIKQNQQAGRQNPQPGQQSATRQSQPTGQSQSTGKQASGQTGKQNSSQSAGQKAAKQSPGQPSKQAAGQNASQNPQTPRAPAIPPGFRLLSVNEGRAIARGISWADDEEGLSPDCSHLVHHLYEQAGYTYPYASSLDLYRGTGQFWRVRYAQPGDLIVWQGHVGIVVDPKEHSFFSTTSSGVRTLNYRSAYWQARGYPRFFRYLTKSPPKGGAASEASNRPAGVQTKEQTVRVGGGGGENRPGLQAVKAAPAPVPGEHATDKSRSEIAASKSHEEAAKSHEEPAGASRARIENALRTSSTLSTGASLLQIPVRTTGHAPQAPDVTSALRMANLEAGEILRGGNLERLERPVVVYRQLQVSGIELKGKRGIARIHVETVAALSAERMEAQSGSEDHQMELQLTKKGWVIMEGNEIAYVPRDGAMRILATRLAALTQSTERGTIRDREQAEIVRFMNLLVE